MTRKVAWGLLSQSSCFFYFPFPKPRVTLAQPWFTFLLSLLGAPWSKGQSRPQRSTGETEPRPWPNPVPRDLEDHSSGHLPQTPAESLQPATWVFLVWLLTQAVSGKANSSTAYLHPFPPIVELVISGSRGSYAHVFMPTGTQRVLSLADTRKETHVHM